MCSCPRHRKHLRAQACTSALDVRPAAAGVPRRCASVWQPRRSRPAHGGATVHARDGAGDAPAALRGASRRGRSGRHARLTWPPSDPRPYAPSSARVPSSASPGRAGHRRSGRAPQPVLLVVIARLHCRLRLAPIYPHTSWIVYLLAPVAMTSSRSPSFPSPAGELSDRYVTYVMMYPYTPPYLGCLFNAAHSFSYFAAALCYTHPH